VGLTEKQKKSLPDNILGISQTNNIEELVEIYTAADVFVNPSREETMGLTTIEAMACGTPVVVSNFTAVPEVVNEECGIIINGNVNAFSLKASIESLLSKRFSPTENVKRFKKAEQFLKYESLYKEV
jgi:glycosyltransferase involved in cell wall biosynthesis